MKKNVFTFALALFAAASTWAQTTFTTDNLKYTITDETTQTVELTGYETKPTDALDIPATVSYNSTSYSVTSIGNYAFSSCSAITQVTIPGSVTSIGSFAFEGCSALTQVNIPNGVTSIGSGAFYNCSALRKAILSNSVKNIGSYAFCSCSKLPEITIPNSVTNIGDAAFSGCNALTQVTWNAINCHDFTYYNSTSGSKYPPFYDLPITEFKFGDQVEHIPAYLCYNMSRITEIAIPNSVTSIGSFAFEGCSALTQVNIPNGVTSIGSGAFYNCSALRKAILSNSVKNIGSYAFCSCSKLPEITIPNSVTNIGDAAFSGCNALTQVTWNAINCHDFTYYNSTSDPRYPPFYNSPITKFIFGDQVEYIPAYICFQIVTLTQVTISNSVTSIGDEAFWNCNALTQVTIPNSVASIGNATFAYCYALTSVHCERTTPPILGNSCFLETNLQLIFVPVGSSSTYASIWGSEYTYVENGSEVELTVHVETQGELMSVITSQGHTPTEVTKLTITGTLNDTDFNSIKNEMPRLYDLDISGITNTTLPAEVFSGKKTLLQLLLPEHLTAIPIGAFMNCSLTSVIIPNSVVSIGKYAFYSCYPLTSLTIGNSVTSIEEEAFKGCVLKMITYNAINIQDFTNSENNPFYNNRSNITNFTFGDQVEHIPAYLCYGMDRLTHITIPDDVTSIGNAAFSGCSSLTQVTWNSINCANLASDDYNPFKSCPITDIIFGDQVEHIPAYLCNGMDKLTQVTWNAINCEDFIYDNRPFDSCPITTFIFGDQVEHIPAYLCYDMDKLTQVTIPNSVTSIGDRAFYDCSALTAINVEGSNTTYCSENGVLFNKDKTMLMQYPAGKPETVYTIPDGVTSIESSAFWSCDALMQVDIPNSVTCIGDNAFYSCSSLMQVTIGSGVTSIGKLAFENCSALTQVTWNAINCMDFSLYTGKYGPFYDSRSNITTFIFGDQVEHIPACLCYGMDKLTEVTIPSSVTSIGSGTFYECSALTAVYYTGDVAGWCGITFAGPTSNPLYYAHNLYIDNTLVTRLNIPDGINEIKDYTFLGCNTLRQATIPDGVTSIGSSAFEGCSKLTQVTIPDGVTSIGEGAFYQCSALTQVTIPESVTSIREWAFSGCSALTQVNIPDNVTSIGEGVFYDCRALTQVTIPESVTSIGEWAFRDCSALTQVTIPNSVTSIGNNAFRNCSALTQVTIGNSVTSIGNSAFSYCSALTEITVLATVPPTVGYDAFYDVNREIPVYVPAEALEDYWVAAVWEEFYYLQAMPANALQTPSMPESISVYGGMLHNPQGLPVSLYDMQGRMVYCGTAATVSQPAGVYVLRCAGASGKVLF